MNVLVQQASQCFDECETMNTTLVASTSAMHHLSTTFVDSIGRRRTACEGIDEAARGLAEARKAGGDASAGIDEIVQGLKARLATILDDLYVAHCVESPSEGYTRLAPARENPHPSAGRYESKSS
jgi:hypothetical protein